MKVTKDLGIHYSRDQDRLSARDQKLNTLYALSDSDFAGCKDTAKSTSGYMILMNGGVVAYCSGRQSTVALCTDMAETIALAKLVLKFKHMCALLHDLQCHQEHDPQFTGKVHVCGLIIQQRLQLLWEMTLHMKQSNM